MSTRSDLHQQSSEEPRHKSTEFLGITQLRAVVALILIAVGIVFFLGQNKVLDYSSSWWVIFIAIPGFGLLWSAYSNHQRNQAFGRVGIVQGLLGIAALLVSLIFIVDPHWSFTQGWSLDKTFPFLSDWQWDRIWPWALVLPGVGILYLAIQQHSLGTGVFATALIVVGAVFILNISWDVVWPLAIIAAGIVVLVFGLPKRS